ncbi:MAG: transposase [Tatlockia sp.]|nr:transposase [Tatlockia sp.]
MSHLNGIKSTRQLMEHICYNLSYRWFCGLTLNTVL